ncbi:GGDEF domain-containing protein [Leucobacter denitrificans]|uniref:GGDEF domain-containing protein n=1 Tax=Leucobacter denitrificans TaxID=683042 RepID=A0A7G9S4Y5_9MICO|nr:GGDEF domain-containing protein [Leucobacter denitrificans]QNN62910.1 GGDEF domain-containing protein [Leucobacter denitrificans]
MSSFTDTVTRSEGVRWLRSRRLRRSGRVTVFSIVTAGLMSLFGILGAFELFEDDITRFETYLSIAILAVGLLVGCFVFLLKRELPYWFGIAFIISHASVQVYYLGFSDEGQNAIAGLQELPVMGMYFAWFYGPRIARIGQALILVAVMWAAAGGIFTTLLPLLGIPNLIGVTMFTWLCVEVGLLMRKRVWGEAQTDELTGVLNRRGFVARAQKELERASRYHYPLSLAIIDLDDFKCVNDTGGHAAGDDLLRTLTSQWKSLCRSSDLIGRLGGDEFVILLPESHLAESEVVMGRLRQLAVHPWSWGIAEAESGDTLEQLLQRADEAMYGEKRGRSSQRS